MKSKACAVLLGALVLCQSCCTSALWRDTDPRARVWIDSGKITRQSLQERGVKYETTVVQGREGYLVEKSDWGKFKDYQLRMLGTPVTLTVDVATTVVVVGVYMFLNDPQGTVALIDVLSKSKK